MNGGITIANDHPKNHEVDWLNQYQFHHVEIERANGYSVSLPSDHSQIFSRLRKPKACSVGGNAWVCSKSLLRDLTSFFQACDKNWLFFIFYGKYQMSSCTTCLIRNSDIPIFLSMNLNNLLVSLSIMAKILSTYLRTLFLLKRSGWGLWATLPS